MKDGMKTLHIEFAVSEFSRRGRGTFISLVLLTSSKKRIALTSKLTPVSYFKGIKLKNIFQKRFVIISFMILFPGEGWK